MRLAHLGLPVRDQQRSVDFYHTYCGFDPAAAQRFPDGTVIVRNADGFDLALHPGEPPVPILGCVSDPVFDTLAYAAAAP
jgi:catechol 2,3-dioxygenase-like lactoylglutathione lyase family enzyme